MRIALPWRARQRQSSCVSSSAVHFRHMPSRPLSKRKAASARGLAAPKPRRVRKRAVAKAGGLTLTEATELADLRRELERVSGGTGGMRWNAEPDDVQRSVARLVLTLVEFIRRLLERQAIRRMEGGTLSDAETEDIGQALMKLEETVRDIAAKFGIMPDDLNLELGPIGKLM
jgi:hypothetical protein